MAVIVKSLEIAIGISPKRMIKAMISELYTITPKLMPGVIKSIVMLQGNGGPGSIVQTNLHDVGGVIVPSDKHMVNVLDAEKGTAKYTLIEGATLGDKIESIVYEIKYKESGDGGCVIKITGEYHAKGDATLNDDDIKESIEQERGFYTAAGEYLIANPDVCA